MTFPSRETEIDMMRDSFHWPHSTVLPIKRFPLGKEMETAFMMCPAEKRHPDPIVYNRNLMDWASSNDPIEKVPSKTYESIEAIVDDGWIVD